MSTTITSDDSRAVALLCSSIALAGVEPAPKPLRAKEWSALAAAVDASSLGRPGALLGTTASDLSSTLALSTAEADRLARLLQRGGPFAIEVERLEGRGIWLMTRMDEDYPACLATRLRDGAPPILYGSGARSSLGVAGLAVVGSRDADERALEFAAQLGRHCAATGTGVYSGAARGVDGAAMMAAAERDGPVVGVLADALESAIRRRDFRQLLVGASLALVTPYHPNARFTPGNAMGRNRIVYALSQAAVVVSTGETGGTWNGAIENLKAGWVPLFVRCDGTEPRANRALVERGGSAVGLEQLLAAPPIEALRSRTGPEGEHAVTNGAKASLFDVVWPYIAGCLHEPRTQTDIASDLELTPSQARAWLRQAMDAGLVDAAGKPRKYRLADPQTQRLFED